MLKVVVRSPKNPILNRNLCLHLKLEYYFERLLKDTIELIQKF